jgi:NAD(P)-dependent dehydrogenase (short-subunit alcohol dehydrogenase family)
MSKDGLCAIVTGSASGLGAATAAVLAKGGGKIAVNYSVGSGDIISIGRALYRSDSPELEGARLRD